MVAGFCQSHKEELDQETFLKLVDKSVLPVVSVTAALVFLRLEMDLVGYADAPSKESAAVGLSSIQERCICALQNDVLFKSSTQMQQKAAQLFVQMPKYVAAQLLITSLTESNKKSERSSMSTDQIRAEHHVLVQGAEPPEFNGMYRWDPVSIGYTMDGNWQGSEQLFRITPRRQMWCISINHLQDFFVAPLSQGGLADHQDGGGGQPRIAG